MVESVHELPNGYRFRLPNDSATVLTAAQFFPLERLCCAFFGFGLEIDPGDGGFCLSLTGREGVNPFIMAYIANLLPLNIRNFGAAGTGSEETP